MFCSRRKQNRSPTRRSKLGKNLNCWQSGGEERRRDKRPRRGPGERFHFFKPGEKKNFAGRKGKGREKFLNWSEVLMITQVIQSEIGSRPRLSGGSSWDFAEPGANQIRMKGGAEVGLNASTRATKKTAGGGRKGRGQQGGGWRGKTKPVRIRYITIWKIYGNLQRKGWLAKRKQ